VAKEKEAKSSQNFDCAKFWQKNFIKVYLKMRYFFVKIAKSRSAGRPPLFILSYIWVHCKRSTWTSSISRLIIIIIYKTVTMAYGLNQDFVATIPFWLEQLQMPPKIEKSAPLQIFFLAMPLPGTVQSFCSRKTEDGYTS